MKNEDVRVEFTTKEGEAKAYYIKKYFDADMQKDIWDFLVIRDGELKTKIARLGQKGRGYAETRILGAGNEASHSASLGGDKESASTHPKHSSNNISTDHVEVNGFKENKLFQPLNTDVDLNKQIPVVMAEIETAPLWLSMKGNGRKAIIDSIAGEIVNESTGETIILSRKNAEHLISSATERGIGGQPHIAAVKKVRDLLKVAERIETYPDRKMQENVKLLHRYYAPLHYDGFIYTVNMAVKEYAGIRRVEIDGVKKLYDLKLEKKSTPGFANAEVTNSNPGVRPDGASRITIRQLLEGVKDKEGVEFFQPNKFYDKVAKEKIQDLPERIVKENKQFQPSAEEISLADAALKRDAKAWGELVDGFTNPDRQQASNRTKRITMLKQTPLVLQMLGAENLYIDTTYGVLDKVINQKHGFPPELVKKIPQAMADPIMAFKTDSATAISDIILMLELKDAYGSTVIVPIALEKIGAKKYQVNFVPSMHVKNYEINNIPRNEWFIKQIEKGNLLYNNIDKSHRWASSVGRQLPTGGTPSPVTFNKKIYTDADLVKLREANPGMYQEGARGSITFAKNETVIRLFQADISTFGHEIGHLFVRDMENLVATKKAPLQVVKDLQALKDFAAETPEGLQQFYENVYRRQRSTFAMREYTSLTAEEHAQVRYVAGQEKLADAFLTYLREGKAPTPQLAGVFQRFKQWLQNLYKNIAGSEVEINNEVRAVFDRMLSLEQDVMPNTTPHSQNARPAMQTLL